jgi:hypothetical protein
MSIKDLEAFLAANPSPVDVEVGKFYQVPCIRRSNREHPRVDSEADWIPVIGPVHDDKELIGFAPLHLHRDTRFAFDTPFTFARSDALARLGRVESLEEDLRWRFRYECAMKRRKCCRATDVWTPVKFTRPLEEAHRRCRIGPDGLCPHRGIPLALGARLQDGSMVCAGHGLRWSAEGHLLPLEDPTEAPS